jgi:competence protein ComEC
MQELKVKNVIIGKQFEESDNLQSFFKIAKEKKINVIVVEEGDRINIEKNIYFDIFWPSVSDAISKNSINNNALVCKINYKQFSMFFTGDIEEEAEKILISKYKEKYIKNGDGIKVNMLQSTVLKVAHHGSKSSSTQDFLELIQPKVALIGVGKNNNFGHPNDGVLERLKSLNCKIYRTDEDGEVNIFVNSKGIIKLQKIEVQKCN